tara:strand:- start:188 stop:370 length:183 start_codon:yes stop_codon:yes gene_type:complete
MSSPVIPLDFFVLRFMVVHKVFESKKLLTSFRYRKVEDELNFRKGKKTIYIGNLGDLTSR